MQSRHLQGRRKHIRFTERRLLDYDRYVKESLVKKEPFWSIVMAYIATSLKVYHLFLMAPTSTFDRCKKIYQFSTSCL